MQGVRGVKTMTREEALKELDQLSRAVKSGPVSQAEVLCPEMRAAARTLSGLRTREKAPSAVPKHQKNRGSVTAARACARMVKIPARCGGSRTPTEHVLAAIMNFLSCAIDSIGHAFWPL